MADDQRQYEELTKNQRVEASFKAAEFWWTRHDKRAQVVWRVHFSLWTALVALIGITLTGELSLHGSNLTSFAIAFSIVILTLHLYYIREQARISRIDRRKFQLFYEQFKELSGLSESNESVFESRIAAAHSTSLFQYANLFGWTVTLVLCAMLVTVSVWGATTDTSTPVVDSAGQLVKLADVSDSIPSLADTVYIRISSAEESEGWVDLRPIVTWESLGTLALIITLIYLYQSAVAAAEMANYMKMDVEFLRKPVISIWCPKQDEFGFPTAIWNPSMVHAKVRVKATLIIDQQVMNMPENHHYGGSRIWQVQAVGPSGPPFGGHIGMEHILNLNGFDSKTFNPTQHAANLKIESWSINAELSDSLLHDDDFKNPSHMWRWDMDRSVWIQEIAPDN